jgi:hypothetical protein
MFRLYLKIVGFLFRIGVMLWFVAMLVLPVYGWLSPWPEADRTLDAEGLEGTKFMIGVGSSAERENDTWSKERQRSYIVLPASLRSMEIFTYTEVKGSRITGVARKVIRSHMAIPLFLLWMLGGWFSARTAILWANKLKTPNQPDSANPAIASLFHAERQRGGVADPARYCPQ